MERIISFLRIITLVAVIVLTGCATTNIGPVNGAYPKTPNGQCIIYTNFLIDTFDGVTADWPPEDNIVIPAGEHRLKRTIYDRELRIRGTGGGTVSYWRGNELISETWYDPNNLYIPYTVIFDVTYNFQKGKKYHIRGDSRIFFNRETGVISAPEGTELVFHRNNRNLITRITVTPKVEVTEFDTRSNGNLFVTPEASGLVGAGMSYGGVAVGQIGERFGIGLLGGKTDIKLVGLGQAGMLLSFSEGIPFGFQYNFGGLFEYYFPKNIGIGAGGGMWGSLLSYDVENKDGNYDGSKRWEHVLHPYLEANVSLPLRSYTINLVDYVIYFHYYPSFGEEWYNTFGFGLKVNLHM